MQVLSGIFHFLFSISLGRGWKEFLDFCIGEGETRGAGRDRKRCALEIYFLRVVSFYRKILYNSVSAVFRGETSDWSEKPMIRKSRPSDYDEMMEIYAIARRFMKGAGNPTQWGDSFPPAELIREDIRLGRGYVCEIDGRLQAVFAMIPGEDPTYQVIEGSWLNDRPYCAVHRVASRGEVKGMATQVLGWCLEQCGNIRIDTHDDNLPMQRVLEKNGFTKCGRIWCEDGTPRIAYQRTVD